MTTCAVIPIKDLHQAKGRLAAILSREERIGLTRAMLADLLATLRASPWIDRMLVVTSDATVAALARDEGAHVLPEPETPGLISAVTCAAEVLAAEGIERMIFVPGDVPLLSLAELSIILTPGEKEAPEMTIVPASDLGGSNCIVCSPPDCLPFGFGVDSFRRHLRLAREAGITPRVVKLPGVGLDVDTEEDLLELIAFLETTGVDSGTHEYLKASGIIARLFRDRRIAHDTLTGGRTHT